MNTDFDWFMEVSQCVPCPAVAFLPTWMAQAAMYEAPVSNGHGGTTTLEPPTDYVSFYEKMKAIQLPRREGGLGWTPPENWVAYEEPFDTRIKQPNRLAWGLNRKWMSGTPEADREDQGRTFHPGGAG